MQAYSNPERENDPHALPDLEVFEVIADMPWDNAITPGWYWWPCFPGCLPDNDPIGPFESYETALADARQTWD